MFTVIIKGLHRNTFWGGTKGSVLMEHAAQRAAGWTALQFRIRVEISSYTVLVLLYHGRRQILPLRYFVY